MNNNVMTTRYYDEKTYNEIVSFFKNWNFNINNNINFSFTKFGDGEFACMSNEIGQNCDEHPYSNELGIKLKDAWLYLVEKENIYIGQWSGHKSGMSEMTGIEKELHLNCNNLNATFVNYEILLQNLLCQEKLIFFKSLKESKRKKYYIGPKRLSEGVTNFLNIDYYIESPLINSFSEYEAILEKLLLKVENDSIFLFTTGLMTKSLIHKILEKNNNITCLDFGSGLDPIFIGKTREGQIDINTLKNYYIDLL